MTPVPQIDAQVEPADESPAVGRYLVLALLSFAPASAYLTRIISSANTTIAAEFQTSAEVMGDVMSGFALGYFLFQIPGGFLASSCGVRGTLSLMSLCWSSCAVWSSLAGSPHELWLARVAMGVSQAGLVPCCAQAITEWFPVARRGIASSLMGLSMQLGGIVATTLTARLIGPLGWRGALQAYSVTGMAWAVVFFFWFRDRSIRRGRESTAAQGPNACGPEPGIGSDVPPLAARAVPRLGLDVVLKFAASVSVWAFLVQAIFRAYAYEFYTTWCPAFLEKGYGVDRLEAASLTSLPLWTIGIGSLVSGIVVDAVMIHTKSRWLSRSGLALAGLTSCGACFAVATQISDPRLVMIVLAVGAGFSSLAGPATWATAMDLGGRRAAILAGTMNMMGNIGAYYCPKQVGILFQSIENSSQNWNLVLWLFAGVNLAGAAAWILVNPRRPVID